MVIIESLDPLNITSPYERIHPMIEFTFTLRVFAKMRSPFGCYVLTETSSQYFLYER
jgi:hypothetical protein